MVRNEHLDLRALPGSERAPALGAKQAGTPLSADARVEATLVLRRRAELDDATLGSFLSRPSSRSPTEPTPRTSPSS